MSESWYDSARIVPLIVLTLSMSKKQPNFDESLAIECLKYQGFQDLVYEPIPNESPDILINGEIAVEVRRLNQNVMIANGFVGLEQDEYFLRSLMKGIINRVSDDDFVESAFIGYFFDRSTNIKSQKKIIKKRVTDALLSHKAYISEHREYKITDNFLLKLHPSTSKLDEQFHIGITSDGDSGGFVVGLIYDNMKLVAAEKRHKLNIYKDKYPTWWLVLIDTISYGLSDHDSEQFHKLEPIIHGFDRLMLLSGENHKKFRFLYE